MRVPRPDAVFFPTDYLINARLKRAIDSCFKIVAPDAPASAISIVTKMLDLSTSILGSSSAAYHNLEHTALVTQCGLDLVEAISLKTGTIHTGDLTAYIAALLFHDIGYVRGVCQQDNEDQQVISLDGKTIRLPPYATDAFLTPYHVERGKIFVKERLSQIESLDIEKISNFISETTFPVPNTDSAKTSDALHDFAACVQAADLIGQMGDPAYINKLSKLFLEFEETGAAEEMNIKSPVDLKHTYPQFFWSSVFGHIKDHVSVLEQSPRGKKWIISLYKNVFTRQKSETFSLSAQILFDQLLKLLADSKNRFEIYYGLAKGFLEFYNGFVAHVWEVDPSDNLLHTKRIWYLTEETKKTKKFIKETEAISYEPGHGMPGRCYQTMEPQWHEDFSALDTKQFPRARLAQDLGVKAGLAIPILSGEDVIAVIEIFSKAPRAPSPEDLSFMRLVTDYVAVQFNL